MNMSEKKVFKFSIRSIIFKIILLNISAFIISSLDIGESSFAAQNNDHVLTNLDNLSQPEQSQNKKHQQQKLKTFENDYYPFPRIIWVYWNDQKTLSSLENIFLDKFNQIVQNPQNQDWRFNLVTDDNILSFFQDSQQIMQVMSEKSYTTQLKSDYIRLCLLEEHGGIYIDLTTIFYDDLTWLSLENLFKSQIILNKHSNFSSQPDVLMTYWSRHGYEKIYVNEDRFKVNNFPGYESYFIASKKKAKLITDWKNALVLYMEEDCAQIFQTFKAEDSYIGDFWYDCYFKVYFSLYALLSKKQKQLDSGFRFGEDRLTANYYYKIWTFQCSNGPGIPLKGEFYKNFFQLSVQDLQKSLNLSKIYYFSKLTSIGAHLFQDYRMIFRQQSEQRLKQKSPLQIYKEKNRPKSQCYDFKYLNKESVVYRYLKNQLKKNDLNVRAFNSSECKQFEDFCFSLQGQNVRGFTGQGKILEQICSLVKTNSIQILISVIGLSIYIIIKRLEFSNAFEAQFQANLNSFLVIFGYHCQNVKQAHQQQQNIQISEQQQQQNQLFQQKGQELEHLNINKTEHGKTKNTQNSVFPCHDRANIQNDMTKCASLFRLLTSFEMIALIQLMYLTFATQYLEWSNQKQQHSLITVSMIVMMVVRRTNYMCRFSKEKIYKGKIAYILAPFQTFMFRVLMSKMFLEMVYFQPQSVQLGSLHFSYFILPIFDIYQDELKLFQFARSPKLLSFYIKNKRMIHKVVAILFLFMVFIFEDLRYLHIFGDYLIKQAYEAVIMCSMIIAVFIIILQVYRCYCEKYQQCDEQNRKNLHPKFKSTQKILIRYLMITVVEKIFQSQFIIFWKERSSFRELYMVLIILLLVNPLKEQNYLNSIVSVTSLILILVRIVVSKTKIQQNDIELRFQEFSDNIKPLLSAMIPLGIIFLMVSIIRQLFSLNAYKVSKIKQKYAQK